MKQNIQYFISIISLVLLCLFLGAGLLSGQVDPDEVILARSVSGEGIYHNSVRLIIDGSFADEAGSWDGERCVYWEDDTAVFIIDLGTEFAITGILIQADDNDDYRLAFSSDGEEFTDFFTFYAGYGESGKGMDSMSTDPESPFYVTMPEVEPVQARFIRLQAANGDGSYAVAELQVLGSELDDDSTSTETDRAILRPAAVRGEGTYFNEPDVIIDGRIPPEGSDPGIDMSVFWEEPDVSFVIDLGAVCTVTGILVQVDCDDSYRVEYSVDDRDYFTLTEIAGTDGEITSGLDSLSSLPDNAEFIAELEFFPVEARFIKFYALEGVGLFAVSEVQIFGERK